MNPMYLINLQNFLKNKHLLVTGGLGFIGKWVVDCALNCGAQVTIIDRNSKTKQTGNVQIIQADLLTYNRLRVHIKEADVVIHLAGSLGTEKTFNDIPATVRDNILASAELIKQCMLENRRTIFTTVGNNWTNPYTITKNCAADLCMMTNMECGSDFRVLKIMNAYGPWQAFNGTKKIIPSFFRQCLLNIPIEIYGDGHQEIDLIHAYDVAIAILLATGNYDLPRDKYLEIGTFIPRRVIDVANHIKEITRSTSSIRFIGKRKGEPLNSVTVAVDNTFCNKTRFSPQVTFEKGILGTFEWYLNNPFCLKIPSPNRSLLENCISTGDVNTYQLPIVI